MAVVAPESTVAAKLEWVGRHTSRPDFVECCLAAGDSTYLFPVHIFLVLDPEHWDRQVLDKPCVLQPVQLLLMRLPGREY